MASDPTVNTLIRFPHGGASMDVKPGGMITADGAQAAAITALKVNYTTGDLDTEAEIIAALNTTNTALNSIITALENIGVMIAN